VNKIFKLGTVVSLTDMGTWWFGDAYILQLNLTAVGMSLAQRPWFQMQNVLLKTLELITNWMSYSNGLNSFAMELLWGWFRIHNPWISYRMV